MAVDYDNLLGGKAFLLEGALWETGSEVGERR
jgi:hypothetical protein